jgi:hypothetical protein
LNIYPARAGDNELPGEVTDGETPVPIPNTEAKLVRPMVVRKGESRYRQDYEPCAVTGAGLAFFYHCFMEISASMIWLYNVINDANQRNYEGINNHTWAIQHKPTSFRVGTKISYGDS